MLENPNCCIHLDKVTRKTKMIVVGLLPLGEDAPRSYLRFDLCDKCYQEFVSNIKKIELKEVKNG